MTAYDIRPRDSAGAVITQTGLSAKQPTVRVMQRRVSVLATNYAGPWGTNTSFNPTAVGAGDTFKVMTLPSGVLVLDVRLQVNTLGVGNLSVGDSGSGTQYMAATSIASTGFKTMAATPGIKMYTAADYILLTYASANDGATAGQLPVVTVSVSYIDYNTYAEATTFTP